MILTQHHGSLGVYGKGAQTVGMPAEDCHTGAFHVGLTVKDLEHSLAFYRDVAGMTLGKIFHGANPEFDTLTKNPSARLRGVHLTVGMLHLLQYLAPRVGIFYCELLKAMLSPFFFGFYNRMLF